MTEEQFIEKFRDLVYNMLNTKGIDTMYGEKIETQHGTFDVELSIVSYNNE